MSPRVEFKADNKVAKTNYDYPKLKLKTGERARILVGLESPIVEYVHTLRKPQVINGIPQMTMEKRKDQTEYETNKMDFVGRPLCLGDGGILADKGIDPKNCPICKLAQSNPDMTGAPQRRYAMHIIRYRTKPGSVDVATPFAPEVLVWSFTDTVFNKIVDAAEEWGDLRKHDLLLGPCKSENFQQFDISVAAQAAWLENPEAKALTVETFKSNQIPDLSIACGSAKELRWIEEDLTSIKAAWAEVSGATAAPVNTTSLDSDLSGLMGGDDTWADGKTEAEAAAEKATAPAASDDDLLADLDSFAPSAAEEAPAPAAPAKSDAVEADNFDDLLGSFA